MLRNNLTIPVHRLSQMPLCAHITKSFSFRHFKLQGYLRQQENTTSCGRMVCGMIMISKNVTLLSAE